MRHPLPRTRGRLGVVTLAAVLIAFTAPACGGGSDAGDGSGTAGDDASTGGSTFGDTSTAGATDAAGSTDHGGGATDPGGAGSSTGTDDAGGPGATDAGADDDTTATAADPDTGGDTGPAEEPPCEPPAMNPCPNACADGDVPEAGTCVTNDSCACGLFCEFGKCRPMIGASAGCACPDSGEEPIDDPVDDPVGDPFEGQCAWPTPNSSDCNPWCQLGCEAGEHCAIDGDHFGCVVAGGAPAGSTCETSADCVVGSSCFGTVDDPKSTCRVPCADESFCDGETTCSELVSLSFALDVWFCAQPPEACEFWAQDCGGADKCVLVGGQQICVASTAEGGLGASCSLVGDCVEGLLCTGGACVQPCTTAAAPPAGAPLCTDCPNGHETVSVIYDIGRCQ